MNDQTGAETKKSKTDQTVRWLRIGLGGLALIAIIWFVAANSQKVTVQWFVVETSSRLWLVILLSAVLGALIDRAIRWRRGHSHKT